MEKRREDGFAVILVKHQVVHRGGERRVGGMGAGASIGSCWVRGPAVLWGKEGGGLEGA